MEIDYKKRLPEIVLFLAVFTAGAWFHNGANVNQVSRFDMIYSFVEPGTPDSYSFRINRFCFRESGGNTYDWANNPNHDRNVYSNKAPGPALMGIPVYYFLYHMETIIGFDPWEWNLTYINFWLINVMVTVIPLAVSAPLFYRFLVGRMEGRSQSAWWLTCSLYFATLSFPFSTSLWGHTTAMAFVVGALYFLNRNYSSALYLCGAAIGMAVLSDLCAGFVLLGISGLLLARKNSVGFLRFSLGGLPVFLVYGVYHQICFGNFLTPAAFFSNPAFVNQEAIGGLFFLESIREAVWGLSFSSYRGLFWYMPLLLLVPLALLTVRNVWKNGLVIMSAAIILGAFVFNISFNGWHGGMATGPRYLMVSFPFYFVIIAYAWRHLLDTHREALIRMAKACFVLLAILAFCNMLMVASITPMAFEVHPSMSPEKKDQGLNPLKYFYPAFFEGMIQPMRGGLPAMRDDEPILPAPKYKVFNVGQLLGLPGWVQVLPLVLITLGLLTAGAVIIARESYHDKRLTETDDLKDSDA